MKMLLNTGGYPAIRPRRLRAAAWRRDMVAETVLTPSNLIQPLFVIEGTAQREAVDSLPGVERLSIDFIIDAARAACEIP